MYGTDAETLLKKVQSPLIITANIVCPICSGLVESTFDLVNVTMLETFKWWLWSRIYTRGLENLLEIFNVASCNKPIPIKDFDLPIASDVGSGLGEFFKPNAGSPAHNSVMEKIETGSYDDLVRWMKHHKKTPKDMKAGNVLTEEQLGGLEKKWEELEEMIGEPTVLYDEEDEIEQDEL